MAKFFSFDEVPKHKYRVIMADPDWAFSTYSQKGQKKSAGRHYLTSVSSADEISSQPVRDMIHPDGAVLFLWCTWPTIFDAKQVIDAWGFQYSGLAWEWIKKNPKTGKYAFGGGYGTRKNLEPCILARTSNFKLATEVKNRSTRDFLYAAKREHSRKPDEQYGRIENMFDGPYLELYARQEKHGWDAAGNEVDKFDFC